MRLSAATTYGVRSRRHPFTDEASIVAAAKNGDGEAFNVLATKYRNKILNIVRHITGNLDDAEDVTQQALMKSFLNLSGFRGASSFSSWLTRIAINEALIWKRRPFQRAEVSWPNSSGTGEPGIALDIADVRPNPEQLYEKQERRRLVIAAIKEIKPTSRMALEICNLNERSVKDLALVQSISLDAAKSRLSRSRNLLRAKVMRFLRAQASEGAQSVEPTRMNGRRLSRQRRTVVASRVLLCSLLVCLITSTASLAQQAKAPDPQGAEISGTVMDTDDNVISGATVVLEDAAMEPVQTAVTSDDGEFTFANVRPKDPHIITVKAAGHLPWTSAPVTLNSGSFFFLRGIDLKLLGGVTSVTVTASEIDVAREQLRAEEQQRVFGVIPNFYVTYDTHPAPLTAKIKFALALKLESDPVTVIGAALFAGADQAADTPDYGQGAKGYAQRFGANYANIVIDNIVGSAILPSLLHQDPRYFYKSSGTTKSRLARALGNGFICRGDNGQLQPDYSAIGGDLITGAVSNLYYPARNRGGGLVLQNAALGAGARIVDGLLQEFVLRPFTTRSR